MALTGRWLAGGRRKIVVTLKCSSRRSSEISENHSVGSLKSPVAVSTRATRVFLSRDATEIPPLTPPGPVLFVQPFLGAASQVVTLCCFKAAQST